MKPVRTKKSTPTVKSVMLREGPADKPGPIRRFLALLGPGFITGASDDDPSGIGTYAVAGAQYGFATLWSMLICFPLMTAVQLICARIGMVTGVGLSTVLRNHYPRWLLYTVVSLLFVANTINAGTDIGAIAAAINMLVPRLPIIWLIVPIAAVIVVVQIRGSYRAIARVFKWLALALLAYIASAFLAHPHWNEVFHGTFVPQVRWSKDYLATLVGLLGTTISPYLFFWQADQEVEEEVAKGRERLEDRQGATDGELREAALDVGIGMIFSQIVAYFTILATGATLFKAGMNHITSATQAAEALRPFAGNATTLLFGIGMIGAGFLAVPVLTGASSYAVCEAFGWRNSLECNFRQAPQFYAAIIASTVVGVVINFLGINPIAALFWTAVINGLLAPPLLVIIMLVANNRKVMGERTNGHTLNWLGWAATVFMFAAAIGLVLTWNA